MQIFLLYERGCEDPRFGLQGFFDGFLKGSNTSKLFIFDDSPMIDYLWLPKKAILLNKNGEWGCFLELLTNLSNQAK